MAVTLPYSSLLVYTGTGKSITGAHIAYAFVLLNQMNAAAELATAREFMGSAIEDDKTGQPHLKCVLYCGPSNVSVDVVLGWFQLSSIMHIHDSSLHSVFDLHMQVIFIILILLKVSVFSACMGR